MSLVSATSFPGSSPTRGVGQDPGNEVVMSDLYWYRFLPLCFFVFFLVLALIEKITNTLDSVWTHYQTSLNSHKSSVTRPIFNSLPGVWNVVKQCLFCECVFLVLTCFILSSFFQGWLAYQSWRIFLWRNIDNTRVGCYGRALYFNPVSYILVKNSNLRDPICVGYPPSYSACYVLEDRVLGWSILSQSMPT